MVDKARASITGHARNSAQITTDRVGESGRIRVRSERGHDQAARGWRQLWAASRPLGLAWARTSSAVTSRLPVATSAIRWLGSPSARDRSVIHTAASLRELGIRPRPPGETIRAMAEWFGAQGRLLGSGTRDSGGRPRGVREEAVILPSCRPLPATRSGQYRLATGPVSLS